MGQTRTEMSFEIKNFEEIKKEISEWFGTVASPKLEAQRKRVFEAAFAEDEIEHGKLLETCNKGTECRDKVIQELKVKISETWSTVITELKKSVELATKQTKTEVHERWEELVQCGITFPCCDVPEHEWYINTKLIVASRKRIIAWKE